MDQESGFYEFKKLTFMNSTEILSEIYFQSLLYNLD